MSSNKVTRRNFLVKACWLTTVSNVLLPLFPTSAFATQDDRQLAAGEEADRERIKEILGGKKPAIWVFTGDSITAGVKHTQGYRSYPEVFGERIRYELGRSRDAIINSAISGNSSQNIIDDIDWRIRQFKPNVVSLMIGTNDCEASRKVSLVKFEENLMFLIQEIRKLGAAPILHTPNVIIAKRAPERESLPKYVDVIRKVAHNQQTVLADQWAHWQQSIAQQSQDKIFGEWLNDPLHPNGRGHQEIARLLFKELSIFNPADPTCGAPYYEGDH